MIWTFLIGLWLGGAIPTLLWAEIIDGRTGFEVEGLERVFAALCWPAMFWQKRDG